MNRTYVLDCPIAAFSFDDGLNAVYDKINQKKGGYVCFANVHTVVLAQHNACLAKVFNGAAFVFPDGRPIYYFARRSVNVSIEQISGPDFMPSFIERNPGVRHFFYGSTADTLNMLVNKLEKIAPNMQIAGTLSPPFRALSEDEEDGIIKKINEASPDVIWVGLGAPKQEYWMAANADKLKPAILLGVGAAFNFQAGTSRRAPKWLRMLYLEWLHRLLQEPKRLWLRYISTNTKFIAYMVWDMAKRRM